MKKNDYCMVKPLSGEEHVQVLWNQSWHLYINYICESVVEITS